MTDRRRFGLDETSLVERIGWLAAAGVDYIQVRERDMSDAALTGIVRAAVAAARGTAASILVNDRADVALAAGAHGVHLRGDSVEAGRVRAFVPASFVVGRSVHDAAEAERAIGQGGCDYLLFGTVFASRGKPAGHRLAGVEALRDACRRSARPVIAIGGIDAGRAADVAACGAAGLAGVDVFFAPASAADARETVRALRRAFDSGSALH